MKDKEKQITINRGAGARVDLLNNEIEELTKAKAIEEMAKIMCGNDCEECAKESAEFYKQTLEEARNNKCLLKNCAKTLYEQGYRKRPESVVLTREEYEKLKLLEEGHITCEDVLEFVDKARKETAEKILNEVLQEIFYYFDVQSVKELNEKSLLASTMTFDVVTDKIFEIATREGVEIKE